MLLNRWRTNSLDVVHYLETMRMYRLFFKTPHGPGQIAAIFNQHVIVDGMALFEQAEDAASNKKVIDFHCEYMKNVTDRFTYATPLYNVLMEAFKVICNKFEPKSSSVEVLATSRDEILKTGGNLLVAFYLTNVSMKINSKLSYCYIQQNRRCVIRGCAPKKILVYGAVFDGELEDARSYGWELNEKVHFNWKNLLHKKTEEILGLNGIYKKLISGAGVKLFKERGK